MFNMNIEYWKAYLRTMSEDKFNLLIGLISAFFTILLSVISTTSLIVITIISVIIQVFMYYKRNRDNG